MFYKSFFLTRFKSLQNVKNICEKIKFWLLLNLFKEFFMFKNLLFITLFSVTTLAEVGFDVNDMSILFPLAIGKPHPAISMANTKGLLPVAILNQVLKFEHNDTPIDMLPYVDSDSLALPHHWYVTSFRFDPCGETFNHGEIFLPKYGESMWRLTSIEKCQPRLRIVAQPFNMLGQPTATAMHLIYKLDAATAVRFVKGLESIKLSIPSPYKTNGLPLMIHPGLSAEVTSAGNLKKTTTVGTTIKSVLSKTLLNAKLELVTMTINISVRHWKMVGGYVENNVWKRFVTPFNEALYDPTIDESIRPGEEELTCDFHSRCISKPNQIEDATHNTLTYLFHPLPDGRPRSVIPSEAIQTISENIDNPKTTQLFNTNCISCHESGNHRNRERLLVDDPLPLGVTPFTPRRFTSDEALNVLNFGYDGTYARVSTRVASESVVVTNYINSLRKVKNSGLTVTNVQSFWKCLMSDDGTEIQKCLTKP